jgi:hypothetical protein
MKRPYGVPSCNSPAKIELIAHFCGYNRAIFRTEIFFESGA